MVGDHHDVLGAVFNDARLDQYPKATDVDQKVRQWSVASRLVLLHYYHNLSSNLN